MNLPEAAKQASKESLRDQQITYILGLLAEKWRKHPEQRFFQMLANEMGIPYLCITGSPVEQDTFHIQDEDLIKFLKRKE